MLVSRLRSLVAVLIAVSFTAILDDNVDIELVLASTAAVSVPKRSVLVLTFAVTAFKSSAFFVTDEFNVDMPVLISAAVLSMVPNWSFKVLTLPLTVPNSSLTVSIRVDKPVICSVSCWIVS